MTIISNPEKCTGCQICQLQCSNLYHEEFNVSKARIRIIKSPYNTQNIVFTEDCTHCGVCAKFCAYGALKIGEGE